MEDILCVYLVWRSSRSNGAKKNIASLHGPPEKREISQDVTPMTRFWEKVVSQNLVGFVHQLPWRDHKLNIQTEEEAAHYRYRYPNFQGTITAPHPDRLFTHFPYIRSLELADDRPVDHASFDDRSSTSSPPSDIPPDPLPVSRETFLQVTKLTNLTSLRVNDCDFSPDERKTEQKDEDGQDGVCLAKLSGLTRFSIINSLNVTSELFTHLSNLTFLDMRETPAHNVISYLPYYCPQLRILRITVYKHLDYRVPRIPSLRHLTICGTEDDEFEVDGDLPVDSDGETTPIVRLNPHLRSFLLINVSAPVDTLDFRQMTDLLWLTVAYAKDVNLHMQNMRNLHSLALYKIRYTPSEAFHGLTALEKLTLVEASSITKEAFQYLSSLRNLTLRDIPNVSSGAFRHLSRLETLRLHNAPVIENEAFRYLSSLRKLTIGGEIGFKSAAFKHLTGLQYLRISPTKYGKADLTEDLFTHLQKLTYLSTTGVCVHDTTLVQLQELVTLAIQNQPYATEHALINIPTLRLVDITNCRRVDGTKLRQERPDLCIIGSR